MEMTLEGLKDPEDLVVSVSPDEFRDHPDKGMGNGQKGLFLLRMVELLEKLIGVIQKFVGHPFEQDLVLQVEGSGRQGQPVDFGSIPPGGHLLQDFLFPLIAVAIFLANRSDLASKTILLLQLFEIQVFPQKDLPGSEEVVSPQKREDFILNQVLRVFGSR